jgi:5-methyltetrahydrofolate--homocysteine methyltransferase
MAHFLKAGADIILTNSFGANAPRLKLHKAEHRATELNAAAAQLAREAIRQHFEDTGHKAIVAGSIGPTGELFEPLGTDARPHRGLFYQAGAGLG